MGPQDLFDKGLEILFKDREYCQNKIERLQDELKELENLKKEIDEIIIRKRQQLAG